ncbi:MAG: hypothetical protein DHS20C20_24350 [Ardenticatenaceae bacterium]|nr:MAG: hypothetical protein DHS20C20_24350 [Ardenticatenaceae bacterium]
MENHQIEALLTFLQAAGQQKRLHILGILAEQTASVPEMAKRTGLKETAVIKHLNRLKGAALVIETSPFTYQLNTSALEQINHTVFHRGDSKNKETLRQRVLRHYTDGPYLKLLPENEAELIEVVGWLAELFDTETNYPEKEVNERIHQAHPDHAQMRRLLVDYGFMTRSRGIYQKVAQAK